MDRDGILKQLGEQKCGIYCQYEEKAEEVTGEIRHCKKKGRWFVAAQLSTFLLAMISIAIYAMYYAEMIIVASGIFFVLAYIAARRLDNANSEKLERLRAVRAVYMNETAYLNGNLTAFRDGKKYVNPHHEFSFDLDVFGEQSLFQRINRTVTSGGSDLLAGQLCMTGTRTKLEIENQRDAVNELAIDESLRTSFMAVGAVERRLNRYRRGRGSCGKGKITAVALVCIFFRVDGGCRGLCCRVPFFLHCRFAGCRSVECAVSVGITATAFDDCLVFTTIA